DGAIIEIYTLEALRGRLLVGPYSRFGWHHPGPMFFYLLAPWYWSSGLHTAGAQAGALVINLTAAAVMGAALRRAASMPVVFAVSMAIAPSLAGVGDLTVGVGNPHAIVLPLFAFVVVAAGAGAGANGSLLVWLAILGSFLVQTHLAMAPIVAAISIPVLIANRDVLMQYWRRP